MFNEVSCFIPQFPSPNKIQKLGKFRKLMNKQASFVTTIKIWPANVIFDANGVKDPIFLTRHKEEKFFFMK